jgi:RND family efflux transporter MFP subunit
MRIQISGLRPVQCDSGPVADAGRQRRTALALLGLLCLVASPSRGEDLDCLIQPWRDITLSAAIEGRVEEVLVERGDLVKRGDVVARLESSLERASVEAARARSEATGGIRSGEARLELAKSSFARQQTLQEQKVVSSKEVDEALATKRVAEAELQAAREDRRFAALELARAEALLERRTIRSPLDAVVVERILSEGEYADPPEILKLAQVDPLRVEVYAPLELIGRISVGMRAEVRPEEPVGGAHEATVVVVDRVVDAASATFGVRLELPNPDYALAAGLNCRVRFPLEEATVGAIPGPSDH